MTKIIILKKNGSDSSYNKWVGRYWVVPVDRIKYDLICKLFFFNKIAKILSI